nr:hypothetical protein [Amylibacter sp.]
MALNDRLLTLATGAVLAIGGAAASLLLGDHGDSGYQPNLTVAANMSAPQIPTASDIFPSLVTYDAPPRINPETLPSEATQTPATDQMIFASVEPATRSTQSDAGADVITIAVLDGAPELATPADFRDIVLTRAIATVPAPEVSKIARGVPVTASDSTDFMRIPHTPKVSCALDLRATPIFGARVKLKLTAPCHPNVAVTIRHGGLQFKEQLDGAGHLELKVPVFSEFSRFDVELADGTQSTVGAYIAGLSTLERVGISWDGKNDTFLHAFQNGARIGDTGHIWRLNARDFAASRMDGGGYLTVLGNPDLKNAELAQVYTLPLRATERAQIVSFGIETLRGETTCGKTLNVKTASLQQNSGAAANTLSLRLPECGTLQSSLLLKNALKDMKVARK